MKKEYASKQNLNFAYSTNPDFKVEEEKSSHTESLRPNQQSLLVTFERKNRGGKAVTLIKNFMGPVDDMENLCKKIKTKCGVGGSVKDGEIIIQGEMKQKIADLLKEWGYRVKVSG
ncbi:MAG: translation initiation factor [Bacteroidales bacterium]